MAVQMNSTLKRADVVGYVRRFDDMDDEVQTSSPTAVPVQIANHAALLASIASASRSDLNEVLLKSVGKAFTRLPSIAHPWLCPRKHCRELKFPQHAARDQSIPSPAQRPPPILITLSRGFDQLGIWPKRNRAGADFHAPPLATHKSAVRADDHADGTITMAVSLDVDWNAARHGPRHPVRCQSSACELSNPDRHSFAPEAVRHPRDGSRDHLGIRVSVPAQLVLPAINLAAQRSALE